MELIFKILYLFASGLLKFMSSGPSVAMAVIGENAVNRWRIYIGPMDSEKAKKDDPNSLRAIYGTDVTRNGVHGSRDAAHVKMVIRTEVEKNTQFKP